MSAAGQRTAEGVRRATPPRSADATRMSETSLHMRPPRPPRNTMASWTVTLAAACMAFLASLTLAFTIGINRLADSWDALGNSATVTLPPDIDAAAFGRVLDELSSDPGVVAIDPIDRSLSAAELAPYLGNDLALASELQLSPLVDVEFDRPATEAAPILARRLERLGVSAVVEPNEAVARRLRDAADELRAFALWALAVIGAAAALIVALACVSALAAHAEMVEVLRLIGARDSFVARLFERPLQINAFVGSAVGSALAFTLVVWPGEAPEGVFELAPLWPDLSPKVADWPSFVATPLAFALIATLAARVAVAVALRRTEE